MKKFIVVLGFIFVSATFLITGCSNDQSFIEKKYVYESDTIHSISIDVIDREIEIAPSEDDKIHVEYFESEKEFYALIIEDKKLDIQLAHDKKWTDFFGTIPVNKYRKILIKVPNKSVDILSISTSNEKIFIDEIVVKEALNLYTNGGDIQLYKVNVGSSIKMTSKNGNICGTILGDWNSFSIKCTIKKGECNLPLNKQDGEKRLIANCNNGDIKLSFIDQV